MLARFHFQPLEYKKEKLIIILRCKNKDVLCGNKYKSAQPLWREIWYHLLKQRQTNKQNPCTFCCQSSTPSDPKKKSLAHTIVEISDRVPMATLFALGKTEYDFHTHFEISCLFISFACLYPFSNFTWLFVLFY